MLQGVGGTGLTIAGIRAAETERADRLFADPLAGAFVAAAGAPPSQATGRQAAALRLWVVARTVFLDELVLAACADGTRQVVLLGAGFDTRSFRLPWPPLRSAAFRSRHSAPTTTMPARPATTSRSATATRYGATRRMRA